MPTAHVYPFGVDDGPTQMAADELLLDRAAAGVAALRFYTWSPPTLSLGYFQPAAERIPGLPWVRRASGGAAILHGDGDLTYALAVPPGPPWHDPHEGWLCRFHHLIRDELKARGADPRMVVCGEEEKFGPALCFLHHTPGDIRIGPTKVVGSAQRKHRGATLQHGTIRLRRSELVSELPGVAELAGFTFDPHALADVLTIRFFAATGWDIKDADWTDADRAEIDRLAVKYTSREWNERR